MKTHSELCVEVIVNGAFSENCYIVWEGQTKQGILVDPGDEAPRILQRVRELGVDIQKIICTHAHIDHVGAVAPLKRDLGVQMWLHPDELPILQSMPTVARFFGLGEPEMPTVDHDLRDGQTIEFGGLSCEIIVTPGHSPAGCCLYFAPQKTILVGDSLFYGSIGRTDLPGGDLQTLLRAIAQRLLVLPDDVIVYSGHGPQTTIGHEKRTNPFLQ